jgi:hypothetical protein
MIWWLGWQDPGEARGRLGILYFEKPRRMNDFPMMHYAVEMKSPTVGCLRNARQLERKHPSYWEGDIFNASDGKSNGPNQPRKDLQHTANREDPCS